MATKKKLVEKESVRVIHTQQRESLPASINYRVLSVNDGGGTRIIGYSENYADADAMATRHVNNVSKVTARVDVYQNNEWLFCMNVKVVDGKPQHTAIDWAKATTQEVKND
jgi:hypothetical protein